MEKLQRSVRTHDQAAVVQVARSWIGTPYHHQASAKGVGTDCLGLVRGIFFTLYGFEAETPPAYSRDWAEADGRETMLTAANHHLLRKPVADLAPGDVVIFRIKSHSVAKHAGVMATTATMVHAMEGVPVCEVRLTRWWRRHIAAVFSFPGTQI